MIPQQPEDVEGHPHDTTWARYAMRRIEVGVEKANEEFSWLIDHLARCATCREDAQELTDIFTPGK